jgi:capsid protein
MVDRVLCCLVHESCACQSWQPIYERWPEAAVLSGAGRLPSPYGYDWKRCAAARRIMRGSDWVDRLKDVEAS